MKLGLFTWVTITFMAAVGCRSTGPQNAALDGASESDAAVRKITEYREVVTTYPLTFGQQVRENNLERARGSAETMYRTLETLESSRDIASQVCFGGTQWACRNFKEFMKPDIQKLYREFVMSNSLSTGELLQIATKIETVASFDQR